MTAARTWIIACVLLASCSNGSDHKPEPSTAAGSNAAGDSATNAANGTASNSSAGSGGSTNVGTSSGSGGTQGNAGTTSGTAGRGGGGGAMTSAGSGGSNVQSLDAGVRQDAGSAPDAAIINPASCPASYAELSATSSCATNVGCTYPEGYCTCVGRCSGVAPNPSDPPVVAVWSCKLPPEGCPPGVPTVGAECGEEGHTCYYGGCCIQPVTCRSSGWVVGVAMCPP